MTISAGTDSNRGKKNIVKSKNTGRLRKGLTKANIIDQLNLGPISVQSPAKNSLFKKQRDLVISKAIESNSKLGNINSDLSDDESARQSTSTIKKKMNIPKKISKEKKMKIKAPKSARKGSPPNKQIKYGFTGASELKKAIVTSYSQTPKPRINFTQENNNEAEDQEEEKRLPGINIQPSEIESHLDSISSSSSFQDDIASTDQNKVWALELPKAQIQKSIFRSQKLKSSNNLDSISTNGNENLLFPPLEQKHKHRASFSKFKGAANFDKKKQSKWSVLSKRAKQERLKNPDIDNSYEKGEFKTDFSPEKIRVDLSSYMGAKEGKDSSHDISQSMESVE